MGGPERIGSGPAAVVVGPGAGGGDGRGADAALLVAAGIDVVGTAVDVDEAVTLIVARRPQVAVVDVAGPDAAPLVDAIVSAAPEIPVLVLVTGEDHGGVLAAVRAGAAGVLVHDGAGAALAAAVRRTAAGEAVFSPGLAEVILEEYGRAGVQAGTTPRLTEREADVLRLVVAGLTARQIAVRLVLSPRTVENHIQRTLRKFRLHGRAALVRYAIEHGLA
ncbi:LuxR C-terminal-related transcriptional regulator [Pseudonocardia bannensis]|uniref:Response regulator transcription factor n=1 Tax=Pseudonocardia bannensis TaxID=630973 RepID=A0A848DGY0_9PSEU|nr:response regulator transcription factor [Pseudonocardia bannensis]NMH91826.1 response regulator transcription factor [Pseudonocardia bannensis]